MVMNLPAMQETGFDPWMGKIPWRRDWLPTPDFLSGEFRGQRSPVDYSPWDYKRVDLTYETKTTDVFSTIQLLSFVKQED